MCKNAKFYFCMRKNAPIRTFQLQKIPEMIPNRTERVDYNRAHAPQHGLPPCTGNQAPRGKQAPACWYLNALKPPMNI